MNSLVRRVAIRSAAKYRGERPTAEFHCRIQQALELMAGCPHCGTTVKETPQLSGKVVKCPRCQQAFQMPSLPPPGAAPPMGAPPIGGAPIGGVPVGAFSAPPPAPNAYAPPGPPPKDFSDFAAGPSVTVTSTFRPRAYPAINVLITVLYVIAGLIALGGAIFEIIILVGGAGAMRGRGGVEGGLVAMLTLSLFNLIYCGLGILYCIAMAEMLRLFLDIQNNTHETAYWVRRNSKD